MSPDALAFFVGCFGGDLLFVSKVLGGAVWEDGTASIKGYTVAVEPSGRVKVYCSLGVLRGMHSP